MSWSSNWDDNKSTWNDKKQSNLSQSSIITNAAPKPYSEVLREHNSEAEKVMKELVATTPVIIHCDFGSHDRSSCIIMRGNEILAEARDIELSIPSGWNTYKAKALQIGDLAVVISSDDPEDHVIVHVPTQTWFDNAVPSPPEPMDGYTIEALILWAWKVQQDRDIYWHDLRAYDNSNYKTVPESFMSDFKRYCLSIKVE